MLDQSLPATKALTFNKHERDYVWRDWHIGAFAQRNCDMRELMPKALEHIVHAELIDCLTTRTWQATGGHTREILKRRLRHQRQP